MFLLLPLLLQAAPPHDLPQDLTMRVWDKRQGLPDDSVTSVLQTRDGYLWVGTAGGLARFDGVRFVHIGSTNDPAGHGLWVTALCEDSGNRLWIGTQGSGLLCYGNGRLISFKGNSTVLGDTINSIAEDPAGNLWLGTPTGLVRLTQDRPTKYTVKDGLPNDFVSNVHVARSGTIWITTHAGTCQLKNDQIIPFSFQTDSPGRNPESLGIYEDRGGNLWAFGDTYLINLTEGKHLNHFGGGETTSSTRIWSLCEGSHGELWIGTSGRGLYCFVDDKFLPITLRNGGLTSDVRSLCEDREGNLWLGMYGGGLVRLQPRNVRLLDSSDGMPDRPAICLALNSQGQTWIGVERGGLYAGTIDRFERENSPGTAPIQNLISSVAVTDDSTLWVGTPGSGLYCVQNQKVLHYTTADGLSDNMILSLAADVHGDVWIGAASGDLECISDFRLKRLGRKLGLPPLPITSILPSHFGGVWLGQEGGGLYRVEDDHAQLMMTAEDLGRRNICSLYEDAGGRLWLGTAGGRLGFLSGKRFMKWDLNFGRGAEPILGLLTDKEGNLWVGIGGAVYRLADSDVNALTSGQEPFSAQCFFQSEVAPGTPPAYGWPRAARSADDRLWFALDNGVVVLDLSGGMQSHPAPPIMVENVLVNGRPLPAVSPDSLAAAAGSKHAIRMPANLFSLELQFTGLNFSETEKTRFRHKLDGFDSDWVDNGADRLVRYGRLPAGMYTFRVQSGSANGTWYPNEAYFNFFIPTPWWRSEWAIIWYCLAGAIFVAGIARLVFNRFLRRRLASLAAQQAMQRERIRIAQDMHDEIGSKLTKISFMSERAITELKGQEAVARKLDSIANTSRDLLQSLDEIVWAVNPHNDTLENLAAYLGHYATEYLQNIAVECELHIPRGLPDEPVSAETRHNLFLAFEESLNNALKHGKASRISVSMQVVPGGFEIEIKDNGCGFAFNPIAFEIVVAAEAMLRRRGNGLVNMRQRLVDVGGQCVIESQPGKGARVCLRVPLHQLRKN